MFLLAIVLASTVPDGKPDLNCGAYCLYAALRALETPVGDYKTFEKRLGQPTRSGYSLQQLADGADIYGVSSLGVTTTLANLARRKGKFACIALINDNHYVCIYDIDATHVYIVDPPKSYASSKEAFEALWKGKALLFATYPIAPEVADGRRWVIGTALAIALCVIGYAGRIRYRRGKQLMNKRGIEIFLMIALASACAAACSKQAISQQPRISIAPKLFELGTIDASNGKVENLLRVRNEGVAP
jgi:hypothetical protein